MKLYVGNLPYKANADELRAMFSAHGEVASVSLITDKMTGQAKGFGFVEMPNDDEAKAAMNALNDQPLGGRKMRVNEAQPRTDRPAGDRPFRGPRNF